MPIQILIQGPSELLAALAHELAPAFPVALKNSVTGADRSAMLTVSLGKRGTGTDALLHRFIDQFSRFEARHPAGADLELEVRDTNNGEPHSGSAALQKPFQPIPGLTVHPCTGFMEGVADDLHLVLDPLQSFGTGKHPTTRLCLDLLQRAICEYRRQGDTGRLNLLDIGCGSGILAIAAVKMGLGKALGIEIDPHAARAAEKNVQLNHLEERIHILQGPFDQIDGSFDIVVCNMAPSNLLRCGSGLRRLIKTRGQAILAGFGESQSVRMAAFFSSQGLQSFENAAQEGWGALRLSPAEE